jgi:hypothetical protein
VGINRRQEKAEFLALRSEKRASGGLCLKATGDPPALSRNIIDGHELEPKFSGLYVKPG